MSTDDATVDTAMSDDRASHEPALIVDVEGFEGLLDLPLTLARQQKVDLARISILALANQYLAFIEAARKLRLELAADYLVMAAWLAYLKSRLLIPETGGDGGPSAEEMAASLALRLRRLEAIRAAAEQLVNRPQLGRDVFARGAPSRSSTSSGPNGTRPSTTCSPPMRASARRRRSPMSAWRCARPGRSRRRARRWSAWSAPPRNGTVSTTT